MCPIRIAVQSQIRKIKIERLWIDQWDGSDDQCGLKDFDKNPRVTQYFEELDRHIFLEILDFRIGSRTVTQANSQALGRMAFDSLFDGKWALMPHGGVLPASASGYLPDEV